MPDHIFIYRDGVGDSMRQQVIDFELEQVRKIIKEEYNLDDPSNTGPALTLVIVNKRVRQRFFEKKEGYIFNPP